MVYTLDSKLLAKLHYYLISINSETSFGLPLAASLSMKYHPKAGSLDLLPAMTPILMIRKATKDYQWEGVEVLPYKENGTHFKSISRQTLFTEGAEIPVELRYFEILADGYSTLERHEHEHVVMVIRGEGSVFVGSEVTKIGLHDIVHIPPMTWHQFRANRGQPLGILCLVSCERDRPQRPNEADLEHLNSMNGVKEFIQI